MMTNLNIFLENTYENYKIDEVKTYNDIIKMANFIFDDVNLIKKSCLNGMEYETISFDIVFTDNEEIHRINKEYRKKDSPTDVITFAIFADSTEDEQFIFDGEINLGEIVVSLDRIEEQSKDNNVSFKDELYYIISHGILHLLGFDHQNEEDYNFMVENQKKVKAQVL
jgi:probable rRNA maturation factor